MYKTFRWELGTFYKSLQAKNRLPIWEVAFGQTGAAKMINKGRGRLMLEELLAVFTEGKY